MTRVMAVLFLDASALRIQGSGHAIHFACYDDRLRASAHQEGLKILPP